MIGERMRGMFNRTGLSRPILSRSRSTGNVAPNTALLSVYHQGFFLVLTLDPTLFFGIPPLSCRSKERRYN